MCPSLSWAIDNENLTIVGSVPIQYVTDISFVPNNGTYHVWAYSSSGNDAILHDVKLYTDDSPTMEVLITLSNSLRIEFSLGVLVESNNAAGDGDL